MVDLCFYSVTQTLIRNIKFEPVTKPPEEYLSVKGKPSFIHEDLAVTAVSLCPVVLWKTFPKSVKLTSDDVVVMSTGVISAWIRRQTGVVWGVNETWGLSSITENVGRKCTGA